MEANAQTVAQTAISGATETPASAGEPAPSEPTAWDLALAGKTLLKEKKGEAAVEKLQAALKLADKEGMAADDLALIHYLLTMAAQRAGNESSPLAEGWR